MKTLIPFLFVISIVNANASIEHVEGDEAIPSPQEMARNRGCFEELSKAGCEDPGENLKQFRRCLHEVFPSLSDDCKKMMSNLYRRRK